MDKLKAILVGAFWAIGVTVTGAVLLLLFLRWAFADPLDVNASLNSTDAAFLQEMNVIVTFDNDNSDILYGDLLINEPATGYEPTVIKDSADSSNDTDEGSP